MDLRASARRWGDPALAVTVAAGFAAEVAAFPRAHLPVAPLLAALAGLLLVARRRMPLLDAVLVLVTIQGVIALAPRFQTESIALPVAFLISLYSLGRYARGLEAWLAVPLLVALTVLLVLDDGGPTPGVVVFFVVFDGIPWGAGLAVRLRLDRVRDLRERAAAIEEQSRRAVADERARIARELHDVVSHAIAVTVLQARGSRRLVGRDDDAVRQSLSAVEATNVAALGDMRRLLAVLKDTEEPGDRSIAGLARLAELAERVRAAGAAVAVDETGAPRPLSPGVDLAAYRIVQEALTNVLKHGGPGAAATVRMRWTADALELDVLSSGAAASASRPGGHGLVGAAERAAVVGGSMHAGPVDGGWRVRAVLPCTPAAVTA